MTTMSEKLGNHSGGVEAIKMEILGQKSMTCG
jgi:hypothetical protein